MTYLHTLAKIIQKNITFYLFTTQFARVTRYLKFNDPHPLSFSDVQTKLMEFMWLYKNKYNVICTLT
jgi:hypothetical protein